MGEGLGKAAGGCGSSGWREGNRAEEDMERRKEGGGAEAVARKVASGGAGR